MEVDNISYHLMSQLNQANNHESKRIKLNEDMTNDMFVF